MNSSNPNFTDLKKDFSSKDIFEPLDEKANLNSTIKSNLKFNSELLNKPFGNLKLSNEEKKFNNFDNLNNFNESSASGFFRNENHENNISKISFSGSINFNKSNEFNSSILDSKSKRKPFDKLTFNISGNDQNNIFENFQGFNLTSNTNILTNNLNYKTNCKNDMNKLDKNNKLINNADSDLKNRIKNFENNKKINKKDNLKVENVNKIQNRIKDNLNAKKKDNSTLGYIETEGNINSISNISKKNVITKNVNDYKNNNNLINVDPIIKNQVDNNLTRLNTANNIINDAFKNKGNLDNSRNFKNIRENINQKENSKNSSSNKNRLNLMNNLNGEILNINRNNINNNSDNLNLNNNSSLNNSKFESGSKNLKEKSNLLESLSSVKCMEETHLTELENPTRKNNNLNNQSKIVKNINDSYNNINSISHSKINKCKNKSNNQIFEINESNLNNISEINRTNLSKQEQSLLKSQSKFLNKETLEKAKLFNSQFDNQIPFWIKFFIDIENNPETIQSNSSYFKADDKKKYIKDLIEMVKKDAELFDASQKHQKVKFDGKTKLKSLLLTEVKLTKNNEKSLLNNSMSNLDITGQNNNTILSQIKSNNESKLSNSKSLINQIQEESKCFEALEKSVADADLTQDDIDKLIKDDPINEKLAGVLNQYEKIEKNEAKKKVEKFSDFKKRLSKKDAITDKYGLRSTDSNKFNSVVQSAMNRFGYPNLDNIKENINDDERIFKTIDNMKFPEFFDPFMDLDYSKIQLGYLDQTDLKRLFEIDKKLNMLNPQMYSESINTDLYLMQREFNEGKEKRLKEIEQDYKEKIARIKNKEIKKPSVFDVKEENNQKPIYKDYLQEMKAKKDLKNDLFEIDNKICIIKNQEISEERKNEIYEELNLFYAKNPEYFEREMAKKIPEDFNHDLAQNSMKELNEGLEALKRDLEEFEKRNLGDKIDPNNTYEKFEIKKKEEIKQEMLKNYEKAIDMLDEMHLENQGKLILVEELEGKILEDEKKQLILGMKIFNFFQYK